MAEAGDSHRLRIHPGTCPKSLQKFERLQDQQQSAPIPVMKGGRNLHNRLRKTQVSEGHIMAKL